MTADAAEGSEPEKVTDAPPPAPPAEDELARSEREAAEALRSGAFQGARDTVRVRREDIALEAGLGAASPLVGDSPQDEPSAGASPAAPVEVGDRVTGVIATQAAPPAGDAAPSSASTEASETTVKLEPAVLPAGDAVAPLDGEQTARFEKLDEPAEAAPPRPPETVRLEVETPPPTPEAAPPAPDASTPAGTREETTAKLDPIKLPGDAVAQPEGESTAQLVASATAPAEAAPTPVAAPPPEAPPATWPPPPEAPPATWPPPPEPVAETVKQGKKKPKVERTDEDERLVAALIFLDVPPDTGAVNPFTLIGGSSLLKRAGASLKASGTSRVILAARTFEGDRLAKVKDELALGGYDGAIETWDGRATAPFGTRGRVLILDASTMHDPPAVARLAKFRGERAYVLVANEGDGIRVQVEGNRVLEIGTSLVPFDGVTCGAMNLPIELFERMSELGAIGALLSLARDGLLGAAVERRSVGREIGSEAALSEARQRLIDRASGGAHDTYVNRLLARKLSRPLTSVLVSLGISPGLVTTASAFVGLLGAALITGINLDPAPAVLIAGVVLMIGSAILDCVDDEMASMSVNAGRLWRVLDVTADGIVTAAAVGALGIGAHNHGVASALTNGSVAAVGALIATVLLVLARIPFDDTRDTEDFVSHFIELLARRLVNREVVYLVALVIALNLGVEALTAKDPAVRKGIVLEYSLLGLAAITHAYWAMLGLLLVLRPKKRAG